MSPESDLKIIQSQPSVKLWGKDLDEIERHKAFKGKFVMAVDGRLFAKLYPKSKWDSIELFHDMVVADLGVGDPESMDVKEQIVGGGKIEVELMDGFAECRLYGKSTIYGDYESDTVNKEALEDEIQDVFGLDDMPVSVIADYEE